MLRNYNFKFHFVVVLFFLLINNVAILINTNVYEENCEKEAYNMCLQNCTALLIIDVQNCFVEGGTLPIAGGWKVIPVINRIRAKHRNRFQLVVLSKDWHCPQHISFASQHTNRHVFESIDLQYDDQGQLCSSSDEALEKYSPKICTNFTNTTIPVQQQLWPDHCVEKTSDSEIVTELDVEPTDIIINKGSNCQIDSYSAFYDNAKLKQTDLHGLLKHNHVRRVYVTGLATDYCVKYTSLDAIELGYKTHVVKDATRGISTESAGMSFKEMAEKGATIINSWELENFL